MRVFGDFIDNGKRVDAWLEDPSPRVFERKIAPWAELKDAYLIRRRLIALRDHGVSTTSHTAMMKKTRGSSGVPSVSVRRRRDR